MALSPYLKAPEQTVKHGDGVASDARYQTVIHSSGKMDPCAALAAVLGCVGEAHVYSVCTFGVMYVCV